MPIHYLRLSQPPPLLRRKKHSQIPTTLSTCFDNNPRPTTLHNKDTPYHTFTYRYSSSFSLHLSIFFLDPSVALTYYYAELRVSYNSVTFGAGRIVIQVK
jgi:hypothetical protein